MTKLVLLLIRLYQKLLSSQHGLFKFLLIPGSSCRFQPSCSEYAYQAISKYGILHGSILALKRISRCHPGNPGGYDPLK